MCQVLAVPSRTQRLGLRVQHVFQLEASTTTRLHPRGLNGGIAASTREGDFAQRNQVVVPVSGRRTCLRTRSFWADLTLWAAS